MDDLSEMMKWLQGMYTGDYNRRVSREGVFWRGHFHPSPEQPKEPHWTRALAVGSRDWLNRLGGENCSVKEHIVRPHIDNTAV